MGGTVTHQPLLTSTTQLVVKPVQFDGLDLMGDLSSQITQPRKEPQPSIPSFQPDLMNLDLMSSPVTSPGSTLNQPNLIMGNLDLISNMSMASMNTPTSQIVPTPVNNQQQFDDFEFGDFHAPATATTTVSVLEDSIISCKFVCIKDLNPAITNIDVKFDNRGSFPISAIDFKVSPAKNITINSFNPQVTQLAAGAAGVSTHKIEVVNSNHGQKGLAFKVQLTYSMNGSTQTREAVVSGFQNNY